ncbi:methionine sulfoxide reductase A [Desulfuromonas sp. DDH964]|uniref:peptide-methionine (S)-S-oxide reductase MsrA n=1 Tax=Desulfuromonas sp. DDH964 TaxID=1823759 RepID=UPI00078E7E33|nr:peptide-methionine (S)-S-oxide reductase MsrA [Desulfuromonas sp. DDH964]AMV72939.1 methionine sulfoxide reductase A [Desulfuromonas sp. DDH964]
MSAGLDSVTLGGGCFWCIEAVFGRLQGVVQVVSGYAGGTRENPDYEEVCSGSTGHAEVVQVHFDPALISLAELLEVFWRVHDPTTRNRQGGDIGSQYRSIILYRDEEQRRVAEASRDAAQASGLWPDPIVTEIVPLEAFYPAEGYHQDYYRINSFQPYCRMVISPKLQKLEKLFADRLK